MDDTQGCITVLHRLYNDTHSKEVIDLVNGLVLILHLLVNTEEMLYPTIHMSLNARIPDMFADLVHDSLNVFFPDTLSGSYFFCQVIINFRFQIF